MRHTPSIRSAALDAELATFIQSGISMHAATRDESGVANLSRPIGCRVSPDGQRVTVLLLASHSGGMLADMRANGQVAVVFTLPHTHRTIQLKGGDAAVEPLQDGDPILVARYREVFAKELTSLGYEAAVPALLLAGAPSDLIAVTFTVSAVFIQTPGPTAGTPLTP